MKNHVKPHKNAQKHTKHTQKHKRTHNDDTSRVFGFGCDVGFDCGSCLGWTKHAGHVIPFAVQPMQEPQSKAISQPKPKNRDMSSCCVGATLPYLSCLRGGISKAERPRSAQETPKKRPREARSRPRANKSRPSDAQESAKPSKIPPQDGFLAQSLQEALFNRLRERFFLVRWLEHNACDV